jgi:cytochrome c55X
MLETLLAATLVATVTAVAPPPPRRDELIYLLRQDCGSCHGMTLKGGLGPPLLPSTLSGKSGEALVDVILNGVPGSPMPPWRFEIDRNEARWLIKRLKEGLGDDR